MSGTLTFIFAFVVVLGLIGLAAWLVRRFASRRLGANTQRGRMPRLAVIDAAAVDGRRRLVLVRRDNIEHLLMIGGPTDIVVEPNIVRATARDQLPQRPVGAEPPPRIAPLPDAFGDGEDAEPPMSEPPRPARPAFAEELRRAPTPERPVPERRDPLAGFAAEPINRADMNRTDTIRSDPRTEPRAEPPRLEPRAEPRPDLRGEPRAEPLPPRVPRSEPLMPRVPRQMEPPKAAPIRERTMAPPPPPPPPAPPPPPPNADQNLAEMAQRLEAALRRPAGPEAAAPPVAPEPPQRASRPEPPAPAPAAPAKSSFENLEDEMASLLGRPKSSS
ncbi:MAG: flagellar biosynthetic protein FliO [Bradyrhizobium sp.]|nr:flagellar biosynthetic protein FliO [Bradyrhizobium sp.]